MSKIRIYIQNNIKKEKEIFLSKNQTHYLSNVMRKKNGDEVIIFNEINGEWIAIIRNIKSGIKLVVTKNLRDFDKKEVLDVWICFGIIKHKKINYLVEKVTEIGVTRILPIESEYSEKNTINYERLNKIAVEAVEQSDGISIPLIQQKKSIKEIFLTCENERVIFVCDEKNKKIMIADVLKKINSKKFAIFIGPVGGWSKKDFMELRKRDNIYFVSLGSNILKADTAAVYSLSCLKSLYNFNTDV